MAVYCVSVPLCSAATSVEMEVVRKISVGAAVVRQVRKF